MRLSRTNSGYAWEGYRIDRADRRWWSITTPKGGNERSACLADAREIVAANELWRQHQSEMLARGVPDPFELLCTAYHEAGHQAVAAAHGGTVKATTILPSPEYLGKAFHSIRTVDDHEVALAGPAAHMMADPDLWFHLDSNPEFQRVAREWGECSAALTLEAMTITFGERGWNRVIRALALALLVQGELDQNQTRRVLDRAGIEECGCWWAFAESQAQLGITDQELVAEMKARTAESADRQG